MPFRIIHASCFCLCKIVICKASKSCIYKNSKINVELNLTHTVIRTALSVDERKVLMANWWSQRKQIHRHRDGNQKKRACPVMGLRENTGKPSPSPSFLQAVLWVGQWALECVLFVECMCVLCACVCVCVCARVCVVCVLCFWWWWCLLADVFWW